MPLRLEKTTEVAFVKAVVRSTRHHAPTSVFVDVKVHALPSTPREDTALLAPAGWQPPQSGEPVQSGALTSVLLCAVGLNGA